MDSARTLSENLAALLRREHAALAEFLVALADFDQRRAWAELGYSSLFYVRILCRSHNLEAARRIFGDAVMDPYTRKRWSRRDATPLLRGATAPPAG